MADPKAPVVVGSDGEIGTIDPRFARDAVQHSARLATPKEVKAEQARVDAEAKAAELRDKYDVTKNPVRAIGAAYGSSLSGWWRGLSGGLSDHAILGAAEVVGGKEGREATRQQLAEWQEANPVLSTLEETAGFSGAMALGGEALGAGAAAEGAAAATRGGSTLGRIATQVARGAGEGALFSAGKEVSDSAIQDHALTGEKMVSAIGHGAMLGAGAGLVAGVGSEALSGLGRLRAPSPAATEAAVAGESKLGTMLGEGLQKGADIKTIKALGGSAGDLRALERNVPGGFRRVAQDIRGDIEASTGKTIGRMGREELHEYAQKRLPELGDKLGGMLRSLDEAGTGVAPDVQRFTQRIESELLQGKVQRLPSGKVVAMPGEEASVRAIGKWVKQTQEAFGEGVTFEQWQKARVALDKQIKFEAVRASPVQDTLRGLRSIMESELETAGEAAAKTMGQSFQAEYQATKSLYQSVAKAAELTERGVARELANNSLGLRSTLAALTGLSAGGPVGGAVLGLAGKIVQDRGDMIAADLLDRGAAILGVRRLAARTERDIAKGVGELVGVKPAATVTDLAPPKRGADMPMGVKVSDPVKAFPKVAAAVQEAQANPARVSDRIGKALGPLTDTSPATVAAASAVAVSGVNYLASKLPQMKRDPYGLQPHLEQPRVSDSERASFMRAVEAVQNPTMVLTAAKKGTLTREHVEAVKAVYPKLYEEMRSQVFTSLVESKTQLSYARRVQLGILLDIPTDKTLSPEFIAAIQATYTPAEKAGEEAPPAMPRATEAAPTLQTAMQSAASGGMR